MFVVISMSGPNVRFYANIHTIHKVFFPDLYLCTSPLRPLPLVTLFRRFLNSTNQFIKSLLLSFIPSTIDLHSPSVRRCSLGVLRVEKQLKYF